MYVLSQCLAIKRNTRKYGEWAVITGAANGIGREMARELARRDHSIIALDIDAKNLAVTKLIIERESKGVTVATIQADLSDSSVENYLKIEKQLELDKREVGILVNNAGMATKRLMRYERFELDAIRRTVNVNVMATALMSRLVLPQMATRRRGLIVNMSSILANLSMTYSGVYGSSKAFAREFSSFLNMEYSTSHQVDVVCLTPCAVKTSMLTDFGTSSLPDSIMVSPEYFARSALNAIGSATCYSGCWKHGLFMLGSDLIRSLGLLPATVRYVMGIKPRKRTNSL